VLDDVAWAELSHAYGSAANVPELLRQAASEDDDTAGEAISELYATIFHQGSVYPATVAAVPFLAELARHAPQRRDELVWMLGRLADPHKAFGAVRGAVHAAVVDQLPVLVSLLSDGDALVREAAAYAAVQVDVTAELLWRRWRRSGSHWLPNRPEPTSLPLSSASGAPTPYRPCPSCSPRCRTPACGLPGHCSNSVMTSRPPCHTCERAWRNWTTWRRPRPSGGRTGDPEPLLDGLRAVLAGKRRPSFVPVSLIDDLGDVLLPLLPAVPDPLTIAPPTGEATPQAAPKPPVRVRIRWIVLSVLAGPGHRFPEHQHYERV
jgi:hypothetical protein